MWIIALLAIIGLFFPVMPKISSLTGGTVNTVPIEFSRGITVNEVSVIDSTGAFAIPTTLAVTGNTTLAGTLGVTGAATLSSTLGVTGLITGAAGATLTTGDLTLTAGRLIAAIQTATANCSSNAVTVALATDTKGVITVDQVSGACAITLSGGSAGELVVLDLIYGGDTAWTFVAGGQYIADTFDESVCDDFQSTAADGDHLIVTGIMTDADTIMPLSCHYIDQ